MTSTEITELKFNEPVEIDDGIFGLKLALPFALDHVHCWLIDDGDHWTIIDTGVDNAETRAVWQGLIEGFLAGKPVGRLLYTHFHPRSFRPWRLARAPHRCAGPHEPA